LAKDLFFRDILAREGSLKLETLLCCNKLKSMTVDQKVLLDSIVDSTEVEATEDKTGIRRKAALPTNLPL